MNAHYSRNGGYTITKRTPAKRPAVRTVQRKVAVGPTTAKVIGFLVLMILGIVMLTQSTTNATTAYDQADKRQQLSQAQQEIQGLQLEAERAQSMKAIQDTPVKDTMVPVDRVKYVPKEQGDVAGVSTTRP
jgi:hypothetical protein